MISPALLINVRSAWECVCGEPHSLFGHFCGFALVDSENGVVLWVFPRPERGQGASILTSSKTFMRPSSMVDVDLGQVHHALILSHAF